MPLTAGQIDRMSTDAERTPDGDDWEPPEGDEVTEPDELAEADPEMRQSPLRVEEQPDPDE
jgi:hypothetical protein